MYTLVLFKYCKDQAISHSRDNSFEGVKEGELDEEGWALIIKTHRKPWNSLLNKEITDFKQNEILALCELKPYPLMLLASLEQGIRW